MTKKTMKKCLAFVLCAVLLASCFPLTAFADETPAAVTMTEGDVQANFAPEGAVCVSSDPTVAWVDGSGSLNALKPGTATITVPTEGGETTATVTVEDYADGSPLAGNLKICARYNDSMQFYDGHVYLLFTSYQDGVEITVDDLYGGYEIADAYYKDIRADIANGSNHTGTDADKYFTFSSDMKTAKLDRGEIVTIGMYRGFDLTVPQAALGSLKNSSLWTELEKAGKTGVVETIFRLLESGTFSTDEAVARIKAVFEEIGLDYTRLIDGVVEGGVCFNRELYNQKLEWDQYENVTYEMDITMNQLNVMTASLGGNLNNFSIMKNSCATVALRAWNAAVGERGGAETAYHLSSVGEGIFAIIDAPKTVRDGIVDRLPGYYLNNAEGVAEPGAGYQDETGWVYVSAPEDVEPVSYFYMDKNLAVNAEKTKLATLMNAAKAGQELYYSKTGQMVVIEIVRLRQENMTIVGGMNFYLNDTTVSLDSTNVPESGIWFSTTIEEPKEGAFYYAVDGDGKALPSEYKDGVLSFFAQTLPVTYRAVSSEQGTKNVLQTTIINEKEADAQTLVYRKEGDNRVALAATDELKSGTEIYVKPTVNGDGYVVGDLTLNGESFYDDAHFDAGEGAFRTIMPEACAALKVTYAEAVATAINRTLVQVKVGDSLNVNDYVTLTADGAASDQVIWQLLDDGDGAFTTDGKQLIASKEGSAIALACAESNENVGVLFAVEAYANAEDMAAVTYDDTAGDYMVVCESDGSEAAIPYSGYLVKKGSVLTVVPTQTQNKVLYSVTANGKSVKAGETVTVEDDTALRVTFANAKVDNMPETITFAQKGDTYQLAAKVRYTGLLWLMPVYDSSIRYTVSDPLIEVDENGLMTVAGDVPENGAAVIVTAYAGSGNYQVAASCKVVVGDYNGDRIVGKLTISARPIHKTELVAHGALTFTTYEDANIDVSFYDYFKPNEKYNELMRDYDEHPENYPSDPALCNDNELGLSDRESYFDVITNGSDSAPQTISMLAGESFSISNYSYDKNNVTTVMKAIENGTIATDEDAQELVRQLQLYDQGEEYDGVAAFDSFAATVKKMIAYTNATGSNPVNGHSVGGTMVNREIYNQFRRNDSQMPNNYYTVDIIADELAAMKAFLADPDNNYYSILTKNCATGAVDIWNAALSDREELRISADLTGLAADPMSLYMELGTMRLNAGLDGEGGTDFYPRTLAYSEEVRDAIAKINAIGEVALDDESKAKIDEARQAFDALNEQRQPQVWNEETLVAAEQAYKALMPGTGDVDNDGKVTVNDATLLQQYLAEMADFAAWQRETADVNKDGAVNVVDVTMIQRYLSESIFAF